MTKRTMIVEFKSNPLYTKPGNECKCNIEDARYVYWSINSPSWFIMLDHEYEPGNNESLDDIFHAYAFVKYDGPMKERILQNRDRWTNTWFGFEVFDFELPKPPKVKKHYKEKKVKHLTFTLGDALKESGF